MFPPPLLSFLPNGAWRVLPDSLPEPGPDDDPGPDEDAQGPEQGLFITLPAGQLTLAGFCQGGAADTMAPGPLLATIVDTVTGEGGSGLPGCSGDQLLGVISGARRQRSRDEWLVLSAVAEFARRAGTGVEGEFAADELAFELHLSGPVSHKITRTLLRWPRPGQGRTGTCHDYGQGLPARAARRQVQPGAAGARGSRPVPGLYPQPARHRP